MNDDASSLKFTSIGDLHVKDGPSGSLRELFQAISKSAGALVLCGDLTDTGTPAQAEILAKELRVCSVPVIGVLGNHDYESGHADQVKRILCDAGVHLLDGQAAEVNGVAIYWCEGFCRRIWSKNAKLFWRTGRSRRLLPKAMNEVMRLENIMRTVNSRRAVVVLHYAPIVDTVEGEPLEIYAFLGCSRLAETIDRFKVCAVVHGHAHRGKYEGRTHAGAPVYNVAMGVQKPSGLPYALISV